MPGTGPRWLYVVRIGLARPLAESDLGLLVDEPGPTRCVWRPVPDDPYAGEVLVYGPVGDAAPAARLAVAWLDSMLSRSVAPRLLGVWPADAQWVPGPLRERPVEVAPPEREPEGSARGQGLKKRIPKKIVQGPAIR